MLNIYRLDRIYGSIFVGRYTEPINRTTDKYAITMYTAGGLSNMTYSSLYVGSDWRINDVMKFR